MNVVHISPSYFGDESIVGGGERYALELARAMARLVPTWFVSFGPERRRQTVNGLHLEIFRSRPLAWRRDAPFSASFLPLLARMDVVHTHQPGTPPNVLALLASRALHKPRFLTPLGLSPTRTEHRLTRLAGLSGLLCISQYSAEHAWYAAPRHVIYGGVDTRVFQRGEAPRERKVVCVARLMPHKGINYLIEAMEPDMRLEIYGRPYDSRYYSDLRALASGKDVHFFLNSSDEDVARAYQTSLVAVLPSVHTDVYGGHAAEPELLGLVLLEAMCCGTAVIGTNVTSIPEIVREGENGYLVPPNDPAALRAAIRRVVDDPRHAIELGRGGAEFVRRGFTWEAVARRCLDAYGASARGRL